MKSLNLINAIIIIRLQGAVGSDKVGSDKVWS